MLIPKSTRYIEKSVKVCHAVTVPVHFYHSGHKLEVPLLWSRQAHGFTRDNLACYYKAKLSLVTPADSPAYAFIHSEVRWVGWVGWAHRSVAWIRREWFSSAHPGQKKPLLPPVTFFVKTPDISGITWFAVPSIPTTSSPWHLLLPFLCCELLFCLGNCLVCWREKATSPLPGSASAFSRCWLAWMCLRLHPPEC